ncbi:hypothetical protein D3C75_738220 [compost metagenome]
MLPSNLTPNWFAYRDEEACMVLLNVNVSSSPVIVAELMSETAVPEMFTGCRFR